MSKLRLDYQRSIKPFPWEGVLLLVLALAVMVASGIYYRNLSVQADLLESGVEQRERAAQRQLPGRRQGEHTTVAMALEVKRANEVLRQLSLPWYGLLQTIESAGGKDVALLGLEPDTEKRLVKISGEAKNIAAMLDYIKQLENQDLFGNVYLQSHHIQLQDPERPVRFVLVAVWRVKS